MSTSIVVVIRARDDDVTHVRATAEVLEAIIRAVVRMEVIDLRALPTPPSVGNCSSLLPEST